MSDRQGKVRIERPEVAPGVFVRTRIVKEAPPAALPLMKARAWDVERQCMIAVPRLCFGDDGSGLTVTIEAKDERGHDRVLVVGETAVLMWFTGLYDKNKREIYQSDVLRLRELYADYQGQEEDDMRPVNWIGRVELEPGGFVFHASGRIIHTWFHHNECDREVIGNEFENPELLGVNPDLWNVCAPKKEKWRAKRGNV